VEGSATFLKWKNPNLPIFLRLYIFNVTNSKAVLGGARPVFQEVGPLVYEEKRAKVIKNVNRHNDTLTYRQSVTYFFRPDLSAARQEDFVTFINLPLVVSPTWAQCSIYRFTVNRTPPESEAESEMLNSDFP
jgi:hypothetical protein